jgi:glycerophosphoryl diester phosphodiesterase
MQTLKQYILKNKMLLVAHRGSSGTAPENTRAAYIKALEIGVPAIEIDVHLTKDYEIVCFHDDYLTEKAKSNKSINESTLEELRTLEIGSWFDEKYSNERILTLSDVIDLVKNKAYLVIELKPSSYFPGIFIQKIIDIIERTKHSQFSVFVSFNYEYLKIIKNINKKYLTAAIKIPDNNWLPSTIQSIANSDAVICSISELEKSFVEDARKSGIPLGVYDVDTKEEYLKAINYEVLGIGSNFPEMILTFMKGSKNDKRKTN